MRQYFLKHKTIWVGLFVLFLLGINFPPSQAAPSLASRLKGYILLQVEQNGEAWYVIPTEQKKVYMKDGQVAYQMMRELSLGISNANLAKIPVGIESRFNDTDTDQDGLSDKLEEGLETNPLLADTDNDGFSDGEEIKNNYNPLNKNKLVYDNSLVNRLKGYILLQAEKQGQAWYLNPKDGKRYYMKDGEAAYQIMRYLSLGITNNNLNLIPNSSRTFNIPGSNNSNQNNNNNNNNNNSTSTPPGNNGNQGGNSGGGGGGGGGGNSNPPSADTQVPSIPAGLSALASGTSISLTWTASTDNVGVVGYQILRSTSNGSGHTQIATSNTNSYNNTNLTIGTTYYYIVRAYDAAGNVSANSAQAQATALDAQSPTVPSNLTATASGSQISLAWTASTDNVGVAQYLIERSETSAISGFSQIATSTTSVYVNTHLAVNTTYYYRIRARDAAGNNSAYSTIAYATTNNDIVMVDTQSPTVPSNLTAIASNMQISLAWTASTDNVGVVGYQIFRSTTNGSGYSQISTANTNSYINNAGLNAGTTYYYVIKAYDAAGNVSASSTQAFATVPVPVDMEVPSAPSALTATVASQEVALSWTASTDNVGVAGYQIWRSTTNGSGYVQQTTVNTTVYVDTNLINGTTYYYVVRAYDIAGNVSANSNQIQATPVDTVAPSAPSNLSTSVAGTSVSLSWTASTDNVAVSQYLIERSDGNASNFVQIATANTTTYTNSGVPNNSIYYYRVRTRDSSNNFSNYSNTASATVGTVIVSGPSISGVSGTMSSGQTMTITGSNFGTKSQASPLIWDNFEDGTNNATIRNTNPVIGPAWSVWTNGTDPVYTNTSNRINSTRNALFDFSGSTGYTKFLQYYNTNVDSAYFTFWWRYDKTSVQWSANIKPWDEFGTGTSGICPSIYSGYGSPLNNDGYLRASVTDCGGGTGQQLNADMLSWLSYDSPIDEIHGQWVRMEMYLKQSSAPNVNDGIYKMWVHKPDGEGITLDISSNNVITRNTMDEWYQWWILGAYHTMDERSPYATGQVRGDDIYFDTTQARIELGNAATWNANTRREIQIPGSWSSNTLSFTANQGSFTAGQTAYLYVIDSNGNVNSSGYPVTIAGTTTVDQNAPSNPSNLSASVVGSNVSLSWTASTDNVGVAGYQIWRSTTNGGPYNTFVANSNTNSYTHTNVPVGTYYYVVKAYDAVFNYSSNSNQAIATIVSQADTSLPSTPTSLSASASGTTISLSWTASTDNIGVARYLVERSTSAVSGFVQIATPTTNSYTDSGLNNSTTYYYRVSAQDAAGNTSSSYASANATTGSASQSTTNLIQNSWDFSSSAWDGDASGTNPWSPRSNFVFTGSQADPFGTNKAFQIALSNSNTRPYQQRDSTPDLILNYDNVVASLYVKYGNTGNMVFGLNNTTTNTEYEQTFNFTNGVPAWSSGVNDGTTVTSVGNGWYRITMRLNLLSRGIKGHSFKARVTPAGSSATVGAYSYVTGFQLESGTVATAYIETPSGTTPPPSDTSLPSTPTSLSASASGTTISLSWTASTDNIGVARYLVERSTSAVSGFVQIATPTTNSYTDSGLNNSTTYYYRVSAQDAAGNTSSSYASANATTGVVTPPPSGSVSISGVSGVLSQGQTVTISGSGFGTKSSVVPMVYDTMESGDFSSAWQSHNQLVIGSDVANRRHTNSTYYGTNNFQNNLFQGAGFFTGSNSELRDTWYARYWFKLDNNWDWGTTGYPNLTDASLANVKFFRLWNPGDAIEDWVMATQGYSGGSFIHEASNIPGTFGYFGSQNDWTKGTWHVLDFAFKENSSLGVADGVIKMWSDGKKILDKSNIVTRNTFSGLKRPLILGFYNSWWDSGSNSDRDDFYIDDAYIDGSWARVMICNQATWNDSVSRHCEIQAPQSTWNNNTVQISFNAGSFTAGQTAYLYIVDANGNVNSSGYPVTIN